MVGTDACNCVARVCSATLTMVVSKMTARKPTTRISALMLALLGSVNDQRSSFTAVVTAAFTGLLASTGLSPADVRARLLGDRPMWSNDIYRRAHERGELDLDKVPPAVLSMPFDLMRHDLLMTLKPVPAERLASIVDDLFLPLVAAYRGTVRSGA